MNRPTGVTVISILYFIGAALCLLGGIIFIAGGGFLATIMNQQGGGAGMAGMMAGLGAFLGVVYLIIGAVEALVGWGLIKLKNWARIVAIVFSALGAGLLLLSLLGTLAHFSIVNFLFIAVCLAIHVVIIMYLLKPEVKAAFQGAQMRAASA